MPEEASREQHAADKQPLFWCQQILRVEEKIGLKIAGTLTWIITREWSFLKVGKSKINVHLPRDNSFALAIKYLEVPNSKYR